MLATHQQFIFERQANEVQFYALLHELRCPKCENQSLAESDAAIALTIQQKIYDFIQEGQTKEAIVDYFVARYGPSIRYQPQHASSTWLLWYAPGILLCSFILFWFSQRLITGRTK